MFGEEASPIPRSQQPDEPEFLFNQAAANHVNLRSFSVKEKPRKSSDTTEEAPASSRRGVRSENNSVGSGSDESRRRTRSKKLEIEEANNLYKSAMDAQTR